MREAVVEKTGSRSRWAWLAFAATIAVLALVAADWIRIRIPDRREVVDVLVEAGRTGEDVAQVVARRGYEPRAWGRAMLREGADPTLASDVEKVLCQTAHAPGADEARNDAKK